MKTIAAPLIATLVIATNVAATEFNPNNCEIENGLSFHQVRLMLEQYDTLIDNKKSLDLRNAELDEVFTSLISETDKLKKISEATDREDKLAVEKINALITDHNLKYVSFQDKKAEMLEDVLAHNLSQQEFATKYIKVEFCKEHLDFYALNGFSDVVESLEASLMRSK